MERAIEEGDIITYFTREGGQTFKQRAVVIAVRGTKLLVKRTKSDGRMLNLRRVTVKQHRATLV